MKISIEPLRRWFLREKRSFPWREEPTPYRVWVSEVMLQQTRASVVIPYFEKWMDRFPTILSLSLATEEEVIKLWEGLGYYSRARSLLEGAQKIVREFGGEIPKEETSLQKIKGLGPYTIGAIRSFAFHEKGVAVDGNVLRVIARVFEIEEEIDRVETQRKIRSIVETLLPDVEPWVIMEGLIELGATHCGKVASCTPCPLRGSCCSFASGRVAELPRKKGKEKTTHLKRSVYIIRVGEKILLQKHEGAKVMSGLWEFPYVEEGAPFHLVKGVLQFERALPVVTHTFTRYRALLTPSVWLLEREEEVRGYKWVPISEMGTLPFSSGHKTIYRALEREHAHFAH